MDCINDVMIILQFSQNKYLKDSLLDTHGKALVYATDLDNVWGIGLSYSDPRAENKAHWKGKNLLGKTLTELRKELMAEKKYGIM